MKDLSRRDHFRTIYDSNYSLILGYALRRTATAEDATDVVAETFLAAWRRLDDVPAGEGARLWLYGVARRVLSNQRRGERRRERLGARLRLDPRADREAAVEPDVELQAVRIAFERLRRQDREVLALVGWEGLGPREISVVLCCSPTAARIRLHRARKRFALELSRAGISVNGFRSAGQAGQRRVIDSLGTEDVL